MCPLCIGFPTFNQPRDHCLVKGPGCMSRSLPRKGPGIAGVGRWTASMSGIAVSLETHTHTLNRFASKKNVDYIALAIDSFLGPCYCFHCTSYCFYIARSWRLWRQLQDLPGHAAWCRLCHIHHVRCRRQQAIANREWPIGSVYICYIYICP